MPRVMHPPAIVDGARDETGRTQQLVRGPKSAAFASDADDAPDGPLRQCVATRAERPPEELIRFVASPDGIIVPDLARRLPGRGVWVSAEKSAISSATKTKAFARSLKRPVEAPADLAETVEALILKRVCEALSLANKAGLVVTGFTKVDSTVEQGKAIALIHGAEAADDGRQKLDRKFEHVEAARGRTPRIVGALTIEQLSLAMGRANVVHAALIAGGSAERFLSEAERLERYRRG